MISKGKFMFCLSSQNECDNEIVQFKDDRRAVGMLQPLREQKKDTQRGDWSTRVRPRLVFRTGKTARQVQSAFENCHASTTIHNITSLSDITRTST